MTDMAVWRPSTGIWYVMLNGNPQTTLPEQQWGLIGDLPTAGDFDGDGKADFAVWRPSDTQYYVRLSTLPANETLIPLGQAGNSAIYNKPPVTPFIGPR